MSVKNDLDIILITYNRVEELKKTFCNFFSEDCPIRDYSITVLDNDSTDGTGDFVKGLCDVHPNLKYIKNNRNVGVCNNIIKAMELASRKWLWILGDDDDYNWEAWNEVEDAMSQDYDIINVCWHCDLRKNDYTYLLNELGFVSTGIYNTRNITSKVMLNASFMTVTANPHIAMAVNAINNRCKTFLTSEKIVLENMKKDFTAIFPKAKEYCVDVRNYNVVFATLKTYSELWDKELRYACNEIICLGSDFAASMRFMLEIGIDPLRYLEALFLLSFKQKMVLLRETLMYRKDRVSVSEKIFSLKNEGSHKVVRILGMKIKIRRKNKND